MNARPPIVSQAVHDTTLPDVAFRVLSLLAEQLDLHEYRPVKHEALAFLLHRKRQTIGYAMRELERLEYLRCGCKDPLAPEYARSERPFWYRMLWSREVAAHRPPWSS